MAIVQYPGKHNEILATILLLLPTVINSNLERATLVAAPTIFSLHTKLLLAGILVTLLVTIIMEGYLFGFMKLKY